MAIIVVALLAAFVTSCSQDAPDGPMSTESNETINGSKLDSSVNEMMEIAEESGSAYLIYRSEPKEYIVLNAEDYTFYSEFADIVVTEVFKAPPANQGWKYVGKGKTKLDALAMARTLSKQIGEGVDFEIHVEQESDGYWYLWYRTV
ncbi:MAG: hypothetical protein K2M88_06370 [Muribaculaceae bacterium]|nr:hypothetical protein [Muribaculaceae bacterium]